ncbi:MULTISPECIES: DNA-binding protein [unclassified Clostridioides]|uniref:DNA-binding protein n=1 Tax=unclassified Clostridioides TaxID=2635829 RepID=UPI001D0CD9D4|nr:DNA-binding protein [Clostridioides sp. ES-S-0001-02]MCC0640009.1 DNA-binding protein [Clostridioides sp. ES-S-0049-03]MCC0653767.1 DNA-binding protein [Clostridioides sp. ES-S-0001-03]MCC0655446.1 DNA-binding protein [Clostridioides sp. ES-S-0123-01]MCC0670713.1 DNA-binding protein [Clostridioides sp. ES-S-0145-01]MCC0674771.1 DNA-binding protein [Clostridioides sp. ES-W-0018-02]MCC0679299.1 DNA-binding protein [Clostridioides sp. ES-S-0005-03]MCC0696384.1 DNA-binding protein [Clostridio
MNNEERIDKFLEFQSKGIKFTEIAQNLKISQSTLRTFLNKKGYKSEKGKYILKDELKNKEDLDKEKTKEDNTNNVKKVSTKKKKSNEKVLNKSIEQIEFNDTDLKNIKSRKNIKPKKDRKINITQEDLDKLCEVYDWYLEVKDYNIKPKKISNKKDVHIDNESLSELKTTRVRIDKETWSDFERLCSNSNFEKHQILTQALKEFMKKYKNLL